MSNLFIAIVPRFHGQRMITIVVLALRRANYLERALVEPERATGITVGKRADIAAKTLNA
jgi:hypothetical protein